MKPGSTSFRGLFGDGRRVEIPVIQRDYAQGRTDGRSLEIRVRFVKELTAALGDDNNDTTPLDLDFVYGRSRHDERTLEPLDGQQRLTTLFLLHWYVASLDETFDDFRSWIRREAGGSCFTYRTRPAAREFFDALVDYPAPVGTLPKAADAVSSWLTDSIWFVRGWRRDPTVRGCLTMLDSLHGSLGGKKGLWGRLVSTSSPAIVFRLLPLENFGLSDDLYIKMNARGKPLTQFEVFKAELEQFISSSFGDEPCPQSPAMRWRDYVGRQFDISWTDFMWKHREASNEIDSRFMHLIHALVVVAAVTKDDDPSVLPRRLDRLLLSSEPTLAVYQDVGCLDQDVVMTVVTVMDALAAHEKAPSFVGAAGYVDETSMFRRVLLARGANQDEGLTLVDWVLFYAWCAFILRFAKELIEPTDPQVLAAFHNWMRVVSNLARNSSIDRSEKLLAALKGLRQLVPSAGVDLLRLVANGALDEAGGFNQQQQREERLKARLIVRSAQWQPLIERAERHPYFAGDIEFLLRFSGVFDRHEIRGACDWGDDEDAALRKSFADWYDRACAVFPENGRAWPAAFPEYLWERALLAEGDYLLPRGRNWSFLDERDPYASWKRLLRADTRVSDNEARRDVARRVLAQVDPKDVVASLKTIIASGVKGPDVKPLPGFRKRLVVEPHLIDYCGHRMIRLEDGTAYLLGRTQRNGYHIDLYVYDLFWRISARAAEVKPFDDVKIYPMMGTYPPSRLILRSAPLGLTLSAEKHGADMRLQLQLATPDPQVGTAAANWTTDDNIKFGRTVTPEEAEDAIVDIAVSVRPLLSKPLPT